MSNDNLFEHTLKAALAKSFEDEIKLLNCGEDKDTRKELLLVADQLQDLSLRILVMPEEAKELFFGIYCFKMQIDAIGDVFHIDYPMGKLCYYRNLLSTAMGLEDDRRISEDSFLKASKIALNIYMDQEEQEAADLQLTQKDKRMNRVWRRPGRWLVAAVVFLSVGLGVTITSNAEIRRMIVEWYMRVFSTHSDVMTVSEFEVTIETLKEYRPGFIPERYQFVNKMELSSEIGYIYQDEELNQMSIMLQLPGHESSIDTEGLVIEETIWNGERAIFMTDNNNYGTFACSIDGMPVFISGYLSKAEMIAIANGIEK